MKPMTVEQAKYYKSIRRRIGVLNVEIQAIVSQVFDKCNHFIGDMENGGNSDCPNCQLELSIRKGSQLFNKFTDDIDAYLERAEVK